MKITAIFVFLCFQNLVTNKMNFSLNDNIENNSDITEEKKKIRKRPRRLQIFLIVATAALITILYVNNVLAVNRLLKDIQIEKKKYENLKNYNNMLSTQINSLQSAERITNIAREKLGMVRGQEAPAVLQEKK